MKKNNVVLNTFFVIFCATWVQAKSFAEPANLTHYKATLQVYHDSGAYDRELQNVAENANRYLLKRVELNEHLEHPQKLAMVFDIDETVLTNYTRMQARDFSSTKQFVYNDFLAAEGKPIAPVHALYEQALAHHVAVFFITGRGQRFQVPTEKNLLATGYGHWTGLYFRHNNDRTPSNIPFKSQTRANIEQQGYTIVAAIGDQLSDLRGGHTEKEFKLPNPYYYVP